MLNNPQAIKFLDDYHQYLLKKGMRPVSAKIYTLRIRKYLENGFSVADLCGSLDIQIAKVSKGGSDFNPADHGNTRAALLKLDKKLREEFSYPDYYVSFEQGYESFRPKGIHLTGYSINKDKVTAEFYNSFAPAGKLDCNLSYNQLTHLLYILEVADRKDLFCDEAPLPSAHPSPRGFSHRFGGHEEHYKRHLFSIDKKADGLTKGYNDIISPLLDYLTDRAKKRLK